MVRLNSVEISVVNSMQCDTNQRKKETKLYHNENGAVEKFHARLPAKVPASSVAKIPTVASTDRSVKNAVSGQEDGKDRDGGRENAIMRKGKRVRTVQFSTPCGGKRQRCL